MSCPRIPPSFLWISILVVVGSLGHAFAQMPSIGRLKVPTAADDAAATLVVFNQNDKDSIELAHFYAEKRGIPAEQIVGLKCVKTEDISREDYDATIAEPLRRIFNARGWWKLRGTKEAPGPAEYNKIRFVALIRGIPLKIDPTAHYEGDKVVGTTPISPRNEAAVDSELAVLGLNSRIISGALTNPYYRSFDRIADAHLAGIMLVCRLDAPTAETVKRMITDSLAAEQEGLTGLAYVDARGITEPGYIEGDKWLLNIANDARRRGSPVILDVGPGLFPEDYPMTNAALYFGWYTEHASGPFIRPEFRFARGAIAVHIHSFSAGTLRDPVHNWCGPLLTAGAAATVGNVFEPYLALTVQLDIFHDRLRSGLTFAESAYMGQRVLSWMTTCVGDPLYRPFKGVAELDERPAKGEWADFRRDARIWFSMDRAAGDELLRTTGRKDRSGIIMEGLGLLQLTVNDHEAALASFSQAREYYGKSEDAARVAMHEAVQLRGLGREAEAQALLRKMAAVAPRPGLAQLLESMIGTPVPEPLRSTKR